MPLHFLAPALAGALVATVAASEVPRWDLSGTCGRAGAARPSDSVGSRDQCLADERQAEKEAREKWSTYPAEFKDRCVSEATSGGPPSYVELVECINLGIQADKSEKDGSLGPDKRPAPATKPAR